MKQRRSGWARIITLLIVLTLLSSGAFYIYQRNPSNTSGTAYVQSVSSIVGYGNVGLYAQYNGIVEAKDVIEINPTGSMPVKECFVTAGSKVNEGDLLFTYDVDDLELQFTQLQIDITGVQNNLRTYRDQLDSLNKKLAKAKENEKYDLELQIQTVELDIRKAEYDLEDKQRRSDEMSQLIDRSEVFSPVTGTVRSVRDDSGAYDPYGYGAGGSSAYITIIAGTAFCVKGTANEQTIFTLYIGMPVLIRSRVSETVYRGTIYRIDTDSPDRDQGGAYYYGDGERASKYAFYVELESIEGLLIGQHVLIDLNPDTDTSNALMLPASFLFEENERFYVWAANANGVIEKRWVRVRAYDEETECYEIVEGLALRDRIAFPDETVHAGMIATETAFNEPSDSGDTFPASDDGAWDLPENDGAWDLPENDGAWDVPEDDGTDTVNFGD